MQGILGGFFLPFQRIEVFGSVLCGCVAIYFSILAVREGMNARRIRNRLRTGMVAAFAVIVLATVNILLTWFG
jgi:uncharacterized membrane protein